MIVTLYSLSQKNWRIGEKKSWPKLIPVGPNFPMNMTWECLFLLGLSKKRPKNIFPDTGGTNYWWFSLCTVQQYLFIHFWDTLCIASIVTKVWIGVNQRKRVQNRHFWKKKQDRKSFSGSCQKKRTQALDFLNKYVLNGWSRAQRRDLWFFCQTGDVQKVPASVGANLKQVNRYRLNCM